MKITLISSSASAPREDARTIRHGKVKTVSGKISAISHLDIKVEPVIGAITDEQFLRLAGSLLAGRAPLFDERKPQQFQGIVNVSASVEDKTFTFTLGKDAVLVVDRLTARISNWLQTSAKNSIDTGPTAKVDSLTGDRYLVVDSATGTNISPVRVTLMFAHFLVESWESQKGREAVIKR